MERYDDRGARYCQTDYDQILSAGTIHMGVVKGERGLLFVKTGQGSTIYGQEHKYLELALWAREVYGLSVLVSATDLDKREIFEAEMAMVEEVLPDREGPIYFLGVSKGGLITCWYGVDQPRIKRILTVNAPLMINFHNRTLPALRKLAEDQLVMVYGTLDPSYKYLPFLQGRARVQVLEGADHNLVGSSATLLDLARDWLLYDA